MFTLVTLATAVGLATYGCCVSRELKDCAFEYEVRDQKLAIVSGYAMGVLTIWVPYSLLRGLVLFPLQQHGFSYLVSGPMLFQLELLILAVAILVSGCGSVDRSVPRFEWKRATKRGIKDTVRYLTLAALVSVFVWNLSKPERYQDYRPQVDFTPAFVRDAFPTTMASLSSVDAEYRLDLVAAIPNVVAVSGLIAGLVWLAYLGCCFFLMELNRSFYSPAPNWTQAANTEPAPRGHGSHRGPN